MTYTCAISCQLVNRDQMLETINNLINELKGAKVDIAQLKCLDENNRVYYQPFMVGTLGHNDGAPYPKNGDYIGEIGTLNPTTDINTLLNKLATNFSWAVGSTPFWFYVGQADVLKVVYVQENETPIIIEDDGTYDDIIFPPEHTSFEKYKLSLSFESLRCDTPYTLEGEEYCEISFGGSATLVNDSVRLGNDLVKVSISKYQIKTSNGNITYSTPTTYYVEPLEMPSGSNANTKAMQMVSNNFITNSHTDALSITLQYSFVCDFNVELLKQWFKYARYGTQNISDSNDVQTMSPNLIYDVNEYWSSWGVVDIEPLKAKIVGNIDVENTEGDTLTLSLTMQKQGEE